jgi:hypothetical protein
MCLASVPDTPLIHIRRKNGIRAYFGGPGGPLIATIVNRSSARKVNLEVRPVAIGNTMAPMTVSGKLASRKFEFIRAGICVAKYNGSYNSGCTVRSDLIAIMKPLVGQTVTLTSTTQVEVSPGQDVVFILACAVIVDRVRVNVSCLIAPREESHI